MIHIIEGVDGVGKSTLAARLSESWSADLLHKSAPTTKDWMTEYVTPLFHRRAVVLDRWHMGELVWPIIFKRRSLFDATSYAACCRILADFGAEVTLLIRDEDGIAATLTERGEEDQIAGVLRAQTLYQVFAELTPFIPVNIVHSDAMHLGRSKWTSPV